MLCIKHCSGADTHLALPHPGCEQRLEVCLAAPSAHAKETPSRPLALTQPKSSSPLVLRWVLEGCCRGWLTPRMLGMGLWEKSDQAAASGRNLVEPFLPMSRREAEEAPGSQAWQSQPPSVSAPSPERLSARPGACCKLPWQPQLWAFLIWILVRLFFSPS